MNEVGTPLLIVLYLSMFAAAFMTTAFPLLYAFSPWWRSRVGRSLMIRSLSYALLIDVTLFLEFYPMKPGLWLVILETVLFFALAFGSASTLAALWYETHQKGEELALVEEKSETSDLETPAVIKKGDSNEPDQNSNAQQSSL